MDSPNKVIFTCTVVSLTTLGVWYWYRKIRKERVPEKWISIGKVGELHLYPLKSGRRVELEEAECGKYGLVQLTDKTQFKLRDRFLVVYGESVEKGTYEFKTARTFPKMVLIEISNHDADHVALDAPNMRTLYVKIPKSDEGEIRKLFMHSKEETELVDCGDEAAVWVSRYIKGAESGLRLGFHDENLNDRKFRPTQKRFLSFYPNLKNHDLGIFSDLTSFMLMNKTSVTDLNTRLNKDVTSCQFRPNIIVDGIDTPYVEDKWDWIKIGDDAIFRNVKPCTRCVFTTIDAETGIMDSKKEPLKTLKTYRQLPDKEERIMNQDSPVMGINLGLRKPGIIKLNDIVYIGEN